MEFYIRCPIRLRGLSPNNYTLNEMRVSVVLLKTQTYPTGMLHRAEWSIITDVSKHGNVFDTSVSVYEATRRNVPIDLPVQFDVTFITSYVLSEEVERFLRRKR